MSAIGTRKLVLEIDGETVEAECSKAVITSAEGEADFTSFEDARNGGARDYGLNIVLQQDAATGSLWSKIWDEAGQDVPFVVKPYGNLTAPSEAQPWFEGIATVTEPDGDFLGGEANKSNTAKMTTEVTWPCLARPDKITVPTP